MSVTGLVQPSLVLNAAFSDVPSKGWQTNFESATTVNLGLGGVVADPTGKSKVGGAGAGGVPFSLNQTFGLGFSKTWGDYAISVEPYVSHEAFPNVASQGGTGSFLDGAWGGGFKFGFTAINPPRK